VVSCKHRPKFRSWNRPGVVPTLCGVAAGGAEPGRLVGGFDAFGGDGEAEGVAEVDHAGGEVLVEAVGIGAADAGDKLGCELELV